MKYLSIAKMQTTITKEELQSYAIGGCRGVHESVLRSWHILAAVKELLGKKVDPEVILDLIDIMESKPSEAPEREE